MKNNSVNKRYVPKLRFKGFDNKFKIDNFSNIVSFARSGGTPKSGELKYYKNGIIPFLSINDLNQKYLTNCNKKITQLAIDETSTFIFEKNNILLSIYATIGEVAINKIDVALPQSILGIKIKNNINLEYFYYLLLANKKKFVQNSQIGSQPNLSLKIVNNIQFQFSANLKEQEKISKFLNLLDKQISLLENKLKLTEQIKDWIIEFLYKKAKQNKKIKLSEILVPRIVGHIIDSKGYTPISIMLHGKGFKENTLNVKLTKKGRKYYERFSGDLIIGLQNFHNGSIDILNDEYNKPIMSNAIASFINKSEYPLIIIKYILLSKKHQQYLINIAEGTGQKEFTINKILNSYIWIPTHDLIEKFSKFIKTLELQIRNLQIKKNFLEKNKKYYLDNLFI